MILSWNIDPREVHNAVAGGADGFISKAASPEELVEAVERVHRGKNVLPDRGIRSENAPVLGRWSGDENGLGGRESEVWALICSGLSSLQISQRAYIGINTVKSYIRSAYRTIGVITRPQAVIWALSNGSRGPSIRSSTAPADRSAKYSPPMALVVHRGCLTRDFLSLGLVGRKSRSGTMELIYS